MRHAMTRWLAMCFLAAWCAAAGAAGHSGTPYFQVLGGESGKVERLPLLQTRAEVGIVGTIASVALRQTFENRGSVPVEAVYVFPASVDAAVGGLTMTIGNRVVRGEIREKGKAQAEYTQAKEEGRSAALLEQHDEGVFRMRLANILPGDRIDVRLDYTELLVPRDGVYEFYLPTTFGVTPYERTRDAHVERPQSADAEVTDYALALDVRLRGPLPFARIESPTHAIVVDRPDPRTASATLSPDEAKAATRDFVLRYVYAGADIAGGLLLYPGPEENFFLLTLQPPAAPPDSMIPPREYVFVVDVSGSMTGAPLDLAKSVMRDLIGGLNARDRFNVVLFSGGSKVLAPDASLPATPENLDRATRLIDDQQAGGGTELVPALQTAYALAQTPGMARSIVIVTDGGIAAGSEVSALIRSHLREASVFAFGVGNGVSVDVIKRLARAGAGEPLLVDDMAKGRDEAAAFKRYIERPLLTRVQLDFAGFDAYDVVPAVVPDLFAQRPIVVIGKYRGAAQGEIRLRGSNGNGPWQAAVAAAGGLADANNAPLRTLWARAAITERLDATATEYAGNVSAGQLSHADGEREVTALGLSYSLLTPYTSFVAVDDVVRTDGQAVPVSQPTPLRSYTSGRGDALLAGLRLASAAASATAQPAVAMRDVAGKRFRFDGTRWIDQACTPGQTVLRIRRDSAAYARLLQLRPDLAVWLALGESVQIDLGRYAVLVDARGFSDYPDAVLRRALARR